MANNVPRSASLVGGRTLTLAQVEELWIAAGTDELWSDFLARARAQFIVEGNRRG